MPISVLATKCRYCGDLVGRPREKDRQLSVLDLGGSISSGYGAGEGLLDALEAFRREELAALAQKGEPRGKWYRLFKRPAQPPGSDSSGALAIVYSVALGVLIVLGVLFALGVLIPAGALFVMGVPFTMGVLFAPGLLLLIVLFLGAVLLNFLRRNHQTRRNAGTAPAIRNTDAAPATENPAIAPAINNPAIAILDGNGPVLNALKAAVKTLSKSDTRGDRIVLQRARRQVMREVNVLLDSTPRTWAKLDLAAELVIEALSVDPCSEVLRGLSKEVNEELALYSRK
jgi:hypothetical protein